MADTLDDMLEPGERVLWRDPRGLRAVGRVQAVGLLIILGGWGAAFVLGPMILTGSLVPFHVLLLCFILCAGFLLLWGYAFIKAHRGAALVTDRRVLLRSRRGSPEVTNIRLSEIAAIQAPGSDYLAKLTLVLCSGEQAVLETLRRPQSFARALGGAAGLEARIPPGQLFEILADSSLLIGGLPLAMAAARPAVMLTAVPENAFAVTLAFILLVPAMMLGAFLGSTLVVVAGMILLRPLVDGAEMHVWLRGEHDKVGAKTPRFWTRWQLALYSGFARRLYGQPMSGSNQGAESHG